MGPCPGHNQDHLWSTLSLWDTPHRHIRMSGTTDTKSPGDLGDLSAPQEPILSGGPSLCTPSLCTPALRTPSPLTTSPCTPSPCIPSRFTPVLCTTEPCKSLLTAPAPHSTWEVSGSPSAPCPPAGSQPSPAGGHGPGQPPGLAAARGSKAGEEGLGDPPHQRLGEPQAHPTPPGAGRSPLPSFPGSGGHPGQEDCIGAPLEGGCCMGGTQGRGGPQAGDRVPSPTTVSPAFPRSSRTSNSLGG